MSDTGIFKEYLLNQSQAADYLGVTQRTIRSYIRRGTLAASRIHGSRLVRIKRSDLDNLLRPVSDSTNDGGAA